MQCRSDDEARARSPARIRLDNRTMVASYGTGSVGVDRGSHHAYDNPARDTLVAVAQESSVDLPGCANLLILEGF